MTFSEPFLAFQEKLKKDDFVGTKGDKTPI